MVLKDKACPAFDFYETSDAFIILVEPVLGILLGETNHFLGGIGHSIMGGWSSGPLLRLDQGDL